MQVWQFVMAQVNEVVLEGLSQCLVTGGQGSRMLQSLSGSTRRGLTQAGCHRLVADMNALHKGLILATPDGVLPSSTDGLLTVLDWASQACSHKCPFLGLLSALSFENPCALETLRQLAHWPLKPFSIFTGRTGVTSTVGMSWKDLRNLYIVGCSLPAGHCQQFITWGDLNRPGSRLTQRTTYLGNTRLTRTMRFDLCLSCNIQPNTLASSQG